MKGSNLIEIMIDSQLSNEWKWVLTIVVIGSGLLILWTLYRTVLFKLSWGKERKTYVPVREETYSVNDEEIAMPFTGRLLPIDQVPDPIFSEKMVGDGFALEPTKGEIYSPVNGRVMQIYSNSDAVTFKTNSERNVILHIGVDTSNLKGEGITYCINEGDEVYAGQRVGYIDLELVIPRVSSIISPIVFPDLKENEAIVIKRTGKVKAGEMGIVILQAYKL